MCYSQNREKISARVIVGQQMENKENGEVGWTRKEKTRNGVWYGRTSGKEILKRGPKAGRVRESLRGSMGDDVLEELSKGGLEKHKHAKVST